MLGRRIDGAAGADLVAGHRGNIDDMPGFLLLHIRQRRGDAVQHALDVDVDHPVPLVDLEPLERRLRHQPGIVDDHVDPPKAATAASTNCLTWSRWVTSVVTAIALPPPPWQLSCQCLEAIHPPRPEHDARALRREKPCRRRAQTRAGPGDDDHLARDVVAHTPVSFQRLATIAADPFEGFEGVSFRGMTKNSGDDLGADEVEL